MSTRSFYGIFFVLLASCGPAALEEYIALQSEFRDFRSWPRTAITTIGTSGHTTGPRFVYQRPGVRNNTEPASGMTDRFPQGTILVKTIEIGTPDQWELFAMVKRGGSFNSNGARGWEFFRLQNTADGVPVIVGRGTNPNVRYMDNPDGTDPLSCNDCHGAAAAMSDHVLSSP